MYRLKLSVVAFKGVQQIILDEIFLGGSEKMVKKKAQRFLDAFRDDGYIVVKQEVEIINRSN